MHGRVQRLQRLIDDLLDLSRFESGTVVIDRRPVRLDDVVSGAVDEARFDHPDTDIMVFGSTSDSSSLLVLGDPERLHQVIANLIDNALIHGSAPVELHLSESAAGVRLRVTDCGVGLPPGPPQRVFDRFFRGAAAQAPTENDQYTDGIGHPSIRAGTGLGLAIVRWIVELHGGSIAAGANHPVGARFDVTLPAAPPITPGSTGCTSAPRLDTTRACVPDGNVSRSPSDEVYRTRTRT